MSKFWTKTIFWENMKRTCAILGGPTAAGLHVFEAGDFWVVLSAAISLVGALLAIWATDQNNNGIIDLFENK